MLAHWIFAALNFFLFFAQFFSPSLSGIFSCVPVRLLTLQKEPLAGHGTFARIYKILANGFGTMMMYPLLTTSTECSDPHFSSNVCYDPSTFCPLYHCDQPTYSPRIYRPPCVGGDPKVDEQYVHIVCDTSTQVFVVHFGSRCHNNLFMK
jgi:hypothetical protein